ncbi:hypothetical protein GCM10028791_01800 [Echinicola sediminis]
MALLPGCSYSQMRVVSDIEEIFEGIREVELYGGPLEVTYEGNEKATEISLNAYLESNKENVEISYAVNGDKLTVKYDQRKGSSSWGNFRNEGFISLKGPCNIRLKVNSGSGKAFVSGIQHEEIEVASGSGVVHVNDVEAGRIYLTVGSGKIEAEDLTGEVSCKVSSGQAHLDDVKGNVDATASSGVLSMEDVTGTVHAKVSSGRIKLDDVGEIGELIASSGSISADGAGLGANTELKCSSGSIKVQTNDDLSKYNFEMSASSGSIKVGNQSGHKQLNINNNSASTVRGVVSSGSITIDN